MTETLHKTYTTALVGLLCLVLLSPALADAQDASSTEPVYRIEQIPGGDRALGDFVVGPGKVELEIGPGESKTIFLSVTNRFAEPHVFNLSTEDAVGSADPEKTVDLLGGQRGPYTIRDYITMPVTTLELNSNERARIPVTVTIPADAEPGGHYGSVLVNTVAVKREEVPEGQLSSQSPIVARIGTLFFVTVPGAVERAGALREFSTTPNQPWFNEGPIRFGVLYENTGSVHLAPYGTVSITNTFGEEIAYQELDPWFALPQSLRFREIAWDSQFLIGRYQATLELNRGYQNIIDTETITFWVLPWKVIGAVFLVVFIVILILRSFFSRFEFKRKESN